MKLSSIHTILKNYDHNKKIFSKFFLKGPEDIKKLRHFHGERVTKIDRDLTDEELQTVFFILNGYHNNINKPASHAQDASDKLVDTAYETLLQAFGASQFHVLALLFESGFLTKSGFVTIYHSTFSLDLFTLFARLKFQNNLHEQYIKAICQNSLYWNGLLPLLQLHADMNVLTEDRFILLCANAPRAALIHNTLRTLTTTEKEFYLKHAIFLKILFAKPDLADAIIELLGILRMVSETFEEDLRNIFVNIEHIENIITGVKKLKEAWIHYRLENIQAILARPKYAEKIACALFDINPFVKKELATLDIRKHLVEKIEYWDGISALIGFLIREKLYKLVNLDLIFQYAQHAGIFSKFLEHVHKEQKNAPAIINSLFRIDGSKSSISLGLELLSKSKAVSPASFKLLAEHLADAHLYAQGFVACVEAEFNLNDIENIVNSEISVAIINALYESGISNHLNILALVKPQSIQQPFQLSEPKNATAKRKLINAFETINHPFCHFVLGKIYCGEMWGFDETLYKPQKAQQHLTSIQHDVWGPEAAYSLYNMSLNRSANLTPSLPTPTTNLVVKSNPEQINLKTSFEFFKRCALTQKLVAAKHPAGAAVARSYVSYQKDFTAKWKLLSHFSALIKVDPTSGQASSTRKLKKSWLIDNRDKTPGLRELFDQNFGLVVRKK